MSEMLGQQLVIDNRGGAAGTIGVEIAARATPDGYTLAVSGSSAMVNSKFTYKQLGFDVMKDFQAISLFGLSDVVMVVNPAVPAKSVKDLVALAKAQPASSSSSPPSSQSNTLALEPPLSTRERGGSEGFDAKSRKGNP